MPSDRIKHDDKTGFPVLLGHPWRRTAGSAADVARSGVRLSDGRLVSLPPDVSEHELRLALDQPTTTAQRDDHHDDDEEGQSMNLSDNDDNTSLSELVPLRQATRMHPSLLGRIDIIRQGSERYVRRADLERLVGKTSRGGLGAGARIANAIGDAQQSRAKTMKKGQQADRERASAARRRVSERRRTR